MLKMMESAGPREASFGLLSAQVPPCIPEFMTSIPYINESSPSTSSITPDHFACRAEPSTGGAAGRAGLAGGAGQDAAEERGLQPLVDLEQQHARLLHGPPPPAAVTAGPGGTRGGRSGGHGTTADQHQQQSAGGDLGQFSATSVQGLPLHHPGNDEVVSPLNGATIPPEVMGAKPGPLSPQPRGAGAKHAANSSVEYAWMKEKKPSRKPHLPPGGGGGGPPPGQHPSAVLQPAPHHQVPMQSHQTAVLNGLGK